MDEKINKTTGSQSASKVLALLKQVGFHHEQGIRLKDLIALTGQDRSTTHRLLSCLVDEGFVERAAPSKLYRLGIEAMQLGLVSAGMVPVVDRFRPIMKKIARLTSDTVFLIVRSGDHALCLHREEGAYPIKVFVVEPGTRRVLGASSVGMAILANLPDAEISAMHVRHAREYERIGMSLDKMSRIVNETRTAGYSGMTDFGPEGVGGVGCAFRLSSNSYAGISIAAISSRMPAQRKQELGTLLQQELQAFAWTPDPTK